MNPDRLGTAQWADPDTIAQRYSYGEGAFFLGKATSVNTPIGIDDDRHICLVAGSRAGKGTSIIIPNILKWAGSVVVVDPTGDVAAQTEAQRTESGNQSVFVLDPYHVGNSSDVNRARFNPLDMLDPMDKGVVRDAERVVSALIPPSDTEEVWARNGAKRLLTGIILYVLAHRRFEGRRNLVTVRDLVYRGDIETHQTLLADGNTDLPSPFALLWNRMAGDSLVEIATDLGGEIAGVGERFANMARDAPAQWTGVHDCAISATNFMNNADMRECLRESTFSIDDLKTDPNGISLYLTIPSKDKVEDFRWLRMMITLILARMESVKGQPANGHPVLFLLDEFASLQKMDRIEAGIAEIAKYGVKLCLVLQSLSQLRSVYGDGWEIFLANCGTKLFFGVDDNFTRSYVSELIGQTEIVRTTSSSTQGSSTGTSSTNTQGQATSSQSSESESRGDSYKRGVLNLRDTAGFFRRLAGNAQANDVKQTSSSEGVSTEKSTASGETQSTDRSSTINETLHERALVTPDEVGKLFRKVSDESSNLYPGMLISLLSDFPDPIMVRRANYFEDPWFSSTANDETQSQATTNTQLEAAVRYAMQDGQTQIPFDAVGSILLGDDDIAVIAGERGELAAIDLNSSAIIDQIDAETFDDRPGGGEHKYVGDFLYFLEAGARPNECYTTSHSGSFKTWRLEQQFRLIQTTELLASHLGMVENAIEKAARGRNWSSWSFYNRGRQSRIGLIEVRLSTDKSSLLCLTSWFAIYRCDMGGRLLDGPIVIPDAFNIAPANADASEFFVGCIHSAGARSTLSRYAFSNGTIKTIAPTKASFGSNGIYFLRHDVLFAGGATVHPESMVEIDRGEFRLTSGHKPTIVPEHGLVLASLASTIAVYDLNSMRQSGDLLVGGHESYPLCVSMTRDRRYAVSVSKRSLAIWDLQHRTLIGEQKNTDKKLRHGVIGKYSGHVITKQHVVCYSGYGDQIALINLLQRTSLVYKTPEALTVIGMTDDGFAGDVHIVALSSRIISQEVPAPGLLGHVLKRQIDVEAFFLTQYRVVGGGLVACGETNINDTLPKTTRLREHTARNANSVDLGEGRIAILMANYLLIYSASNKSIVAGPVDVATPLNGSEELHYGHCLYEQIVASPDRERLILRSDDNPILIYETRTLSKVSQIENSSGKCGLLIPMGDSQYVLFSNENRNASASWGDTGSEFVVGNTQTGAHYGTVRSANLSYLPNDTRDSCLCDGGTAIAFAAGGQINVLSLLDDEAPKKFDLHSDTIGVVAAIPGEPILATISSDGTARFTHLALDLPTDGDYIDSIISRAKSDTAGPSRETMEVEECD